jgi:hypothetical protein
VDATIDLGRGIQGMARRTLGGLALLAAVAVVAAACGGPGEAGGSTAPGTPGAAAGSGAIPGGHPLVGTWTVDVTRADLAAGGIADPGTQNENSGRFTWTFAPDGTWTSIQQSLDGAPINSPVFRGTYVVDGNTLIATTAFPEQYADEGLHYSWAVTGDEVRFDLLDPPDPVLPIIVETHPWRRGG